MNDEPIKVMLVDDERIVREGIRHLIDWEGLGYEICAEASNGTEAMEKLKKYNPMLVLLDIRMPGMYGTDFIEKVRKDGYEGFFIILSGYSDFEYAQTALRYGASFYLTKPIDEDELEKAVTEIRQKILSQNNSRQSLVQYRQKAREVYLRDILLGTGDINAISQLDLGLYAPIYQVVLYEDFTPYFHAFDFAEMLRLPNENNRSFESVTVDTHKIILLKGDQALNRFQSAISHYRTGAQKGSPLDMIFLAYGETVSSLDEVHRSYETCLKLAGRRFFSQPQQHVLSYDSLPDPDLMIEGKLTDELSQEYSSRLFNYLCICNKRKIEAVLEELRSQLYYSTASVAEIRTWLAVMFLNIKSAIENAYRSLKIPFSSNASILDFIHSRYYLYEILDYFSNQADMIIHAIGDSTGEGIISEVVDYIEHNYSSQLRLDSIASLFGYSSSYLGKLFTQTVGQNFNSYLDEVRIKNAVRLLDTTDMKVYDIATRVGYSSVDYFHQKFRKRMNISPAEYRKGRPH